MYVSVGRRPTGVVAWVWVRGCTTGMLMYLFSYPRPHCVGVYGDVGKVGKRIPLATRWLGVAKGNQVSALCDMVG